MQQKVTTLKRVQVIRTWVFNKIDRVCFEVRSSNGADKYNTCFDQGRGSCTCDGNAKWHRQCYHITDLRPRYEAIKAAKRVAFVASYDPCMVA